VGLAIHVVRSVAEHLEHHIGSFEHLGSLRKNLAALPHVFCIRVAGARSGARLHSHFKTRFEQARNNRGHQRDAPLPWKAFLRNSNDHEASSPLRLGSLNFNFLLLRPDSFPYSYLSEIFKQLRVTLQGYSCACSSNGFDKSLWLRALIVVVSPVGRVQYHSGGGLFCYEYRGHWSGVCGTHHRRGLG